MQIILVIGGLASLAQGRLLQGLGLIGVAIFVCVTFIWYWREWRGRVTTIVIADEYVLIKELKREAIVFEKSVIANQIHGVYCKRTCGRGFSYEVRIKLQSPDNQDQFVISTEDSKSDAIMIRHFLASHLNVTEIPELSNGLFATDPFLKRIS